jgi:hypothetical protein
MLEHFWKQNDLAFKVIVVAKFALNSNIVLYQNLTDADNLIYDADEDLFEI